MQKLTLALALSALVACGTSPGGSSSAPDATADAAVDAGSAADVSPTEDVAPSEDVAPTEDTRPEEDTAPTEDVAPPEDTRPEDIEEDVPPALSPEELAELCESSCATREESAMGGCPLGRDSNAPCEEWCVDVGPSVEEELIDAYFLCIEQDPLCFQSMLQCVIGTTYPEPFRHTFTVQGADFGLWGSYDIVVGVQEVPNEFTTLRSSLREDAPTFTFDVVMSALSSHLTLWYVDVDGNGECNADADIGGSESLELWQLPEDEIRVPEWRVEISPERTSDASFVCTYL